MFNFLGDSSPASHSFGYVLADKIRMDELKMFDFYRHKIKNISENIITGTFCIDLREENLDQKLNIKLTDEKNTVEKAGILIANGYKKQATLNFENREINISSTPKPWHWRWYNWLGIGVDKVGEQSLEEKINTPISIN